MDHALQTISYIADIGDLLVIMVRLAVKPVASPAMMSVSNGAAGSVSETEQQRRRRVTICCHVFESDEVSVMFRLLPTLQGDHLSGKCLKQGNVGEFYSCQGSVTDFSQSRGNVREKILLGKIAQKFS